MNFLNVYESTRQNTGCAEKTAISVVTGVSVLVFTYSVSLWAEDSLVSLMEGSSLPGLDTKPVLSQHCTISTIHTHCNKGLVGFNKEII